MSRHILRNVRVLDPGSGLDRVGDVLIADGTVSRASTGDVADGCAEEMDCGGLWLFPGLVDMHVHLRQPGNEEAETVETGLKAAVSGGITTVGVMPNTYPPMDSPEEVDRLLAAAASSLPVRVVPIPCVTVGRMGREPVDFAGLASMGVTAFSDDGDPVKDSGILLEALDQVNRFGGVIVEHPEEKSLAGGSVNLGLISRRKGIRGIPAHAETVDVARCLEVAGASEGRLHLTHLSLPRSVELARSGLFRNQGVTLDVTPHHLALDETAVLEFGTLAKMNPPLRTPEQREKLVEMVRDGMVDAVASDHAPHSAGSKDRSLEDAAFGITGLETLLPVTLDILGRAGMEPLEILRLLVTGPSGILGIPAPGLSDGCRADCVLFDPNDEYSLLDRGSFSLSRNTPFMGSTLRGSVKAVWIGELVYREGEFAKN